ncbi:MAG: hypothetical protein R3F35_04065 [Myxococcota bacterium]
MNREYEDWEKWILAEIRRLGGSTGQLYNAQTGLIDIQVATERLASLKGMRDSERALMLSKLALGVSIASLFLGPAISILIG